LAVLIAQFARPNERGVEAMTKADLVERVSERIKLTKKQTELIVNTLFTSVTDALTQGDKVELRGFGSFRVRQRHSRDGRNPKTGQGVHIPPKKVPFFKAGKELREMVDN
jgi:integration host factor subunit beta